MHGSTFRWPAWTLALTAILGAWTAAWGQQAPMLPTDPGYMLATEMDYGMPAAPAPAPPAGARLVSIAPAYGEEDLAAKVAALETEIQKMKQADAKKESGTWRSSWSVRPRGRVFLDQVFFGQSPASMARLGDAQDTTYFSAARLGLSGEGFDVFFWEAEFDFAARRTYTTTPAAPGAHTHNVENVGVTAFKDVYLGIRDLPWAGTVQLGHFKEPMGLEQLTSKRFITFMERSLMDVFIPGRSIGVQSMNVSASERATFAIGVFRAMDETPPFLEDDDLGLSMTMRGTWLPWYDEATEGRGLLHVGMGYSYRNFNDPVQRIRQRPEVGVGPRVVDTGNFGNVGEAHLFNPEAAFVYGPFSIQTEYTGASYVRDGGVGDAFFHGGYVQLSYFLTGEHRPYRRSRGAFDRVRPFGNFFRVRAEDGYVHTGKGAWELAYRWSYIDLDHASAGIFGGYASDHTFGVNWYLTPYARLMLNYIHSHVGPAGQVADTFIDVFSMRAQFDF
jgi:phosphate-selective porin OprO and OprP